MHLLLLALASVQIARWTKQQRLQPRPLENFYDSRSIDILQLQVVDRQDAWPNTHESFGASKSQGVEK
jgi:hypothetical protein